MTRRLGSESNLANLSARVHASSAAPFVSPNTKPMESRAPLISHPDSAVRSNVTHSTIQRGRSGATVPEPLRDTIAALATMPGGPTQAQIADAFEVSQPFVSQARSGHVGSKPPNAERAAKVKERQGEARDLAMEKLMASLNLCTEEKLADMSAKELGSFARQMAGVAKDVVPGDSSGGPTVQVTIYAPDKRDEAKYKVIDV